MSAIEVTNSLRAALAMVICLGLPFAARAYPAYSAKSVHLRAGPARDYPVVAVLPPHAPLDVLGCLSDYSWCDVVALDMGQRGWIYAGNIEYVYEGAPVTLADYGPVIGIGVITFVLGDYWDLHYRGRPWYRDRDHWIRTPRPVQPPLPPHPGPTRPPVAPPLETVPPKPPRLRQPQPAPAPGVHVPPPRSAEPGRPPATAGDKHPATAR